MIRTKIIEVINVEGRMTEHELGFAILAEVPIEKKAPPMPKPGDAPVTPFVVKVNDVPMFVIGHTWDITAIPNAVNPPAATLVLIVQKIPDVGSTLVRAPAFAMDKIKSLIPEPKKAN